jgi:hypothetical protein
VFIPGAVRKHITTGLSFRLCFFIPHTLGSYRCLCVFYIVCVVCCVWFGNTVIATWSRYQIEVKIHIHWIKHSLLPMPNFPKLPPRNAYEHVLVIITCPRDLLCTSFCNS